MPTHPPADGSTGPRADPLVAELRRTLARLEAGLSSIHDALAITDGQGRVVWCNGPFSDQSGVPRLALLGRRIGELLPRTHAGEPLLPEFSGAAIPRQAGSRLAVISEMPLRVTELQWTPVRGEEPACLIVVLRDVSPLMAYQQLHSHHEALARELLICPVTGLANRRGLLQDLEAAIARATPAARLAVIFCDLDRFKEINDLHGHQAGDDLLRAIGRRMAGVLRPADTIGRLGGDEFVVLCRNLHQPEQALEIAGRLQLAVGQAWRLGRELVHPSLSIGIAMADGPAVGADELLRRADLAMYEAKASPNLSGHLYEPAIDRRQQRARDLMLQLRRDLATNRLVLAYQPILHLASGRCVGHEVLVRLQGSGGRLISPDHFVPLAERSGLIHRLGSRVLGKALEQLAAQPVAGAEPAGPTLAINTSPLQLARPDFAAEVLERCGRHGVAPQRLRLEITETSLLSPSEQTLATMEELRAAGVQFHLDDFGTGYSSLSLLSDLPIDAVKIDRSFIAELDHHGRRSAVIVALIQLCRELGLEVIAEGIETAGQLQRLRELGCGYGQGFLLGRPGPLAAPKGPRTAGDAPAETAPADGR
ncbi:MAG: EAL domain-containing protein [Cyanobacteriota bacterium]|nr:EAL domain-containing protein [Cyanobacteriota bacterium]